MLKTLDLWLAERMLSIQQLAEDAQIPEKRLEAIAMGRWTPSPTDRRRIAEALQIPVDNVIWGHTMDPRNIRYRQSGFQAHH